MKSKLRKGRLGMFLSLLFILIFSGAGVSAEKFPSKPITLVVPWAPGGRTDVVARLVAPVYEKVLGQPVMVVNKAGASGYIGMKNVSTARPDGYNMLIAGGGLMVLQYTGESKIRWEEFKWIGQIYEAAATVSVNADSPWKTIKELVDYGRRNPGKLKHGNSGHGGTTHLFSEGFAKAVGIKMIQVVYKGDGPAAVALASNEVDLSCPPLGAVRSLMESKKIRVLALQSDKRSIQFPDIPTLKEKGIDWSAGTFEGFVIPKDTPDDIAAILESGLEKALKDPGLAESFRKLDITLEHKNLKDFTAYVAHQDKKYHDLLQEAGLIK